MSVDNALSEGLKAFAEESRELIEVSEDILLQLEDTPEDEALIGELFRNMHTIKGSAGIFGFDQVVSFTHHVESLLGLVRNGEIKLQESLISTLLQARDHISELIDCALAEQSLTELQQRTEQNLFEQISHYLVNENSNDLSDSSDEQMETSSKTNNKRSWHISVRFSSSVLQNGMDPLSFINYLTHLGELTQVDVVDANLPSLPDLEPENCYLGFEISFISDVSKQEIEDVFEFVLDDCQLTILSSDSDTDEFKKLIENLPQEKMLIGDMLIRSGVLTKSELNTILDIQQNIKIEQANPNAESQQSLPSVGEIAVKQGLVKASVIDAAVGKQKQSQQVMAQQSLRINALKLGQLIDLVGELVIAGANISNQAKALNNDYLSESSENLLRLVDEIRGVSLGLRMVQIGDTFNRFKRVVRDLCKEFNKQIDLKIKGGETELDKAVIEKISDPLMHMVRNAIDHGVEPPEERVKQGKPEKAVLSLVAYHDSGAVVIEINDDGRGIDRQKIVQKAIQNGLLSPDHNLSDKEVYQLIFEAGFSTAEKVSNVSGRGIGMDVVRRNINDLRGQVEINSELGKGSQFKMRIPLTLAIIDGFHVSVGGTSFIIPLGMVDECIELDGVLKKQENRGNYVNLRGSVLPFVRLSEIFGEYPLDENIKRRDNIVVVQFGEIKMGLVVDELLGEQQAVIKPLGRIFENLKCVSGATILGGGDVAMILDVPQLLSLTQVTSGVSDGVVQ